MKIAVNKYRLSLVIIALFAAAVIAVLAFIDLKQQAYIRGMGPTDKTIVRLPIQITPPQATPTSTPSATPKFLQKGK